MKITIDTKEDSHEDIKKIISMLQNMISDSSVILDKKEPERTSDMFSMFGDGPAQENLPENQRKEYQLEENHSEDNQMEDDIDIPGVSLY